MPGHQCPICLGKAVAEIVSNLTGSVTSDSRYLDFCPVYNHCENCGHIYRDADDRIDNAEFYTQNYELMLDSETIEPMTYDEKESLHSDYLVSFIAEYLRDDEKTTFLDIGAGKGNFVAALHESFPRMTISAVEPSKSFHFLKEKRYLRECHNAFFSADDFRGKYFGYINLSEVLEHVSNPRKFLEGIKDVMRDDSYLMISVPNVENDKYDFLSPDHFSRFTPSSIKNLFSVARLEIVRTRIPRDSATMLFILKKSDEVYLETNRSDETIHSALDLIERAVTEARRIRGRDFAFYGQGLIIDYLVGERIITLENIECIIDDNITYQGKKWKGLIDIVSLNDFFKDHRGVKSIFLAMNECYHKRILAKLPGSYAIYGIRH